MVKLRIVFLAVLLAWAGLAIAQTSGREISGTVTGEHAEQLVAATVSLLHEDGDIVTYGMTDKSGHYVLAIPPEVQKAKLWVEVRHLGYSAGRSAVRPDRDIYPFSLVPEPIDLEEVTLENQPVLERFGDTLRYQVMSFAKAEDRSIGDVLRRMPGVEIGQDGAVFYNGEQIDNLYIHGDNLMGGRYGLATKVIRKEMIAHVDVIQHHQPVNVLRDKVLTDKVALNLVLKDENRLTVSTQIMAGGGVPSLYDASVTPILLNKDIKMVNTLVGNNSGVDYRNDFKQLGATNFISNIDNEKPRVVLSQGTVGAPDVPLENYYVNRSFLANLNNLYNTAEGWQFRLNLQGFADRNTLNYTSSVTNYLEHDTITYHEKQAVSHRPTDWHTELNVMANKDKYFFNNQFKLLVQQEDNTSALQFNGSGFGQSLRTHIREFANDFNWIPTIRGKGVMELRWLLNYREDSQRLLVGDGYRSVVSGEPHEQTRQRVDLPNLFSNAYIGLRVPGVVINQAYTAGFLTESQTLRSALTLVDGAQITPYPNDRGNHLRWAKRSWYASANYQIEAGKLRANVELPISYQYIHYRQRDYRANSQTYDLFFNPAVRMSYQFDPEQRLTVNYSFRNIVGDITGVYRGVILRNYRMLAANDADLQSSNSHASAVKYELQHAVNMLFLHFGVSYDQTAANVMLSTEIADDIQRTVVLPIKNEQHFLALNAGISKYSFALKSKFSLNAQITRFANQQLINGRVLPFVVKGVSLNGGIEKTLFRTISLRYSPNAWWNASRTEEGTGSLYSMDHRAFRLDHSLTLQANPLSGLFVDLTAKHSYSSQSQSQPVRYFFVDMSVGHHHVLKGLELDLSLTNLLNVRNYDLYAVSSNQLLVNRYRLRGRMAILRATYNF